MADIFATFFVFVKVKQYLDDIELSSHLRFLFSVFQFFSFFIHHIIFITSQEDCV